MLLVSIMNDIFIEETGFRFHSIQSKLLTLLRPCLMYQVYGILLFEFREKKRIDGRRKSTLLVEILKVGKTKIRFRLTLYTKCC